MAENKLLHEPNPHAVPRKSSFMKPHSGAPGRPHLLVAPGEEIEPSSNSLAAASAGQPPQRKRSVSFLPENSLEAAELSTRSESPGSLSQSSLQVEPSTPPVVNTTVEVPKIEEGDDDDLDDEDEEEEEELSGLEEGVKNHKISVKEYRPPTPPGKSHMKKAEKSVS